MASTLCWMSVSSHAPQAVLERLLSRVRAASLMHLREGSRACVKVQGQGKGLA